MIVSKFVYCISTYCIWFIMLGLGCWTDIPPSTSPCTYTHLTVIPATFWIPTVHRHRENMQKRDQDPHVSRPMCCSTEIKIVQSLFYKHVAHVCIVTTCDHNPRLTAVLWVSALTHAHPTTRITLIHTLFISKHTPISNNQIGNLSYYKVYGRICCQISVQRCWCFDPLTVFNCFILCIIYMVLQWCLKFQPCSRSIESFELETRVA